MTSLRLSQLLMDDFVPTVQWPEPHKRPYAPRRRIWTDPAMLERWFNETTESAKLARNEVLCDNKCGEKDCLRLRDDRGQYCTTHIRCYRLDCSDLRQDTQRCCKIHTCKILRCDLPSCILGGYCEENRECSSGSIGFVANHSRKTPAGCQAVYSSGPVSMTRDISICIVLNTTGTRT
jgi:hypothetical protein